MTTTLADLLAGLTQEELFDQLLAVYSSNGFPVTAWQTGDVDRTRTMAIAFVLQQISAVYIPQIAAGGLLQDAAALANPAWIQLLASENFDLPYNQASYTIGNVLLTSAGAGYTITAGEVIIVFPATGNRYTNVGGGVLAANSTLMLSFVAAAPGANYNDASSSTISLVTPLPGVVATNAATTFTAVSHTGAGTGTITLDGSPVGPHQVIVQINETGASAPVAWSYSLDGAPFVSAGIVTTGTNLGGVGINVTLVNGGSGTSFIDDDEYLFNTPGSWITTQGSNDETSSALAARCQARWGSLSNIPTNSYYELLATSCPGVGSQVTQVIVLPDAVINNRVNIVVAGPGGILPPSAITALQNFIGPRAIGTDTPTVTSPTTTGITYVATVTVPANQLAAAQAAARVALVDYTDNAGINPTLRIAKVSALLDDIASVVDVSGVTINGSGSNVTLGSSTSFVVATFTAANITWVTV